MAGVMSRTCGEMGPRAGSRDKIQRVAGEPASGGTRRESAQAKGTMRAGAQRPGTEGAFGMEGNAMCGKAGPERW